MHSDQKSNKTSTAKVVAIKPTPPTTSNIIPYRKRSKSEIQQGINFVRKESQQTIQNGISPSQKNHLAQMLSMKYSYVFASGPAGTGRTYASVMAAAALIKSGLIDHVFAARPAVTAGEKLGFLPGDMDDKVNPFFRPIYNALAKQGLSEDVFIPLSVGHERGDTIDNGVLILDECQNLTDSQMYMMLTRPGENSYLFANGDPLQCDLPKWRLPNGEITQEASGLTLFQQRFEKILPSKIEKPGSYEKEHICYVKYDPADVVRSDAVKQIVNLYTNT